MKGSAGVDGTSEGVEGTRDGTVQIPSCERQEIRPRARVDGAVWANVSAPFRRESSSIVSGAD